MEEKKSGPGVKRPHFLARERWHALKSGGLCCDEGGRGELPNRRDTRRQKNEVKVEG